ncbi:hypothetical protein [Amnibacterium endophyticum]|uniref:Glycosyl transferase n=1 Tax=Amnibacterium endophyticum TaxID=2109337 RepID=A0ABW4LCE6_9MICO
MSRLVRLVVTAGLLAAYLVLLVSAVAALALPFLVAAIVVVVLELLLSRRAPHLLPESLASVLDVRFRLLSLDVLTALLAARLLPDAGPIVALTVVAVLLLAGGRDLVLVFARRVNWRRAGGPVSWRNLAVPGLPAPQPLRPIAEPDGPFTVLTLLIPLGYTIGEATDRYGAALVAQWIVIAVVLLVLAGRALQYRVLNRRAPDEVRETVRAALEAHAPEVVLHHSGRRGTVEQVQLWVPALLALERPCMILVREQSHLDALDGCGVPVVWAPRSQDVELFMVPTVDLALYPSDSTNINNHLLRVPGVYDVLVGHGDSDEPESRSPIARMYDEIWVAGPAGAARYDYPVSGVPASKVKQIGAVRPPLAEPSAPREGKPVVVYAPTWEAPVDAVDVSSLLTRGRRILDALLARQDVQVRFVPAAPTGARLPTVATELDRLRRLVSAAGPEHAVVPTEQLRTVLSVARFVVADVSPALTEAVRADVPYAVPAIGSLSDEAIRTSFPMAAAGTILRRYPEDVFTALDDALGADAHAADRLALGRTLDSAGDFERRFRTSVDEAIATQRRRRAFARPGV